MTRVAPKTVPPTTCHASCRETATTMRIGSAARLASSATPCVTLLAISSPKERRRSRITGLRELRTNVLQRALHVDADHLLPPAQREVGVVHRLRRSVGGVRRRANGALIETRPHDRFGRCGDFLGIR